MNHSLTQLEDLLSDVPGNLEHKPALSLAMTLYELGQVIEALSDEEYTGVSTGLFTSSMGAQTRHTLDHVRIFVNEFRSGLVNYEDRKRGTPVETSRGSAIAMIEGLIEQLLQISNRELEHPLTVSLMLHSDVDSARLQSTVGREIAFLLNHTIHHNALVSVMLKSLGKEVSPRFGYAPATLQYLANI